MREGPYGKFWGCSTFPTCRGTMPYLGEDADYYDNCADTETEMDENDFAFAEGGDPW